jgi:hypothetical protein
MPIGYSISHEIKLTRLISFISSQSAYRKHFQLAVVLHTVKVIGKVLVGIGNMSYNPLIQKNDKLPEVGVLFILKLTGTVQKIPKTILVLIDVFIVVGVLQKSHQFFFGREVVLYILNRLTCRANEAVMGMVRTFAICQLQIVCNPDKVHVLLVKYRDAKFHAPIPSDEILYFSHFSPHLDYV